MKILFGTTTHGFKTYHYFAREILKKIPESKFSIAFGPKIAVDFFDLQKEIKYVNFASEEFNYLTNKVNMDEIKNFEKIYKNKSIWRIISADRQYGRSFTHDSIYFTKKYKDKYTDEEILSYCSFVIKKTKNILQKFQPDFFISPIGVGGIEVGIMEIMMKANNVKFLVPSTTRVKNFFAFSDNTQLLFPNIDKKYLEYLKKYSKNNKNTFKDAKALYDLTFKEIENPDYFDRINSRFQIKKYNTLSKSIFWFGKTFLFSIYRFIRYSKSSAIEFFRSSIQNLILTYPGFYYKIDFKNENYLYYTLHISPEYSLNKQGVMWQNQLANIELLSKSIPGSFKVIIKEHPGTLVARVRPYNFYKQLKKIPNVFLIDIDSDMHKVVSNAKIVVVISGTAGFEAILRDVPSISFVKNTWDIMNLSNQIDEIEKLPNLIFNEMERMKKISKSERKKRLICFFASVLSESFHITYPNELVYTDIGKDEHYKVCGLEMANGFLKYISLIEKNKKEKI